MASRWRPWVLKPCLGRYLYVKASENRALNEWLEASSGDLCCSMASARTPMDDHIKVFHKSNECFSVTSFTLAYSLSVLLYLSAISIMWIFKYLILALDITQGSEIKIYILVQVRLRSTTHLKFDLTRVWTHDLQIMTVNCMSLRHPF